jgi:hypothetical protein
MILGLGDSFKIMIYAMIGWKNCFYKTFVAFSWLFYEQLALILNFFTIISGNEIKRIWSWPKFEKNI